MYEKTKKKSSEILADEIEKIGRPDRPYPKSEKRRLFSDGVWTFTRCDGGQAHVDACGQGRWSKTRFSCGRHKWMAPNCHDALAVRA